MRVNVVQQLRNPLHPHLRGCAIIEGIVALEIRLKPVEALLFRSDVVAVGKFRCPATHPLFRDSGPCSHHTFVFPRTLTAIRHAGGASFLGNPGIVALYNQHQEYSRTAVSDVDASDWYTLADDVLFDVVDADSEARPFRAATAAIDGRTFLEQRMLFDALDRGVELDPLHVEETILRVLQCVAPGASAKPRRRDADAVERVRELIARDPSRNVSLRVLARAVDLSPFQLCRAFRAHTGGTMIDFRHALRLRLALDSLRTPGLDLTTLALDLGYASHSHFTAAFRRHFGITPSAFRATAKS